MMREVFLVEPLGDARLFAAITGADLGESGAVAAELPGHAIAATEDGIALGLARRPEARASGLVVSLEAEARARLDYWMAASRAAPLVAGALVAGQRRMVDTFVLHPAVTDQDWTRARWDGEWHDLVCEAAEEVARHFALTGVERIPELMLGIGYRALARARGRRNATPVALRSGLGAGDIEEQRFDIAYANYFCVEEHLLRFRRFDGAFSAPVERAVFTSGDAATIVPYDPKRDAILLIEQFRPGPYARRDPRPWCLETIAGRCDPMESAETTARREAEEEAAVSIGRVERIGGYYPSPGTMSEYIEAFVGEADLGEAGGDHGLAAEDENIRGFVVPLGTALAAVASGEVNNAPLLLSLLWLEKHAERLRRDWGHA
jgi:nudix-type nucleoside diphosphatase (YffH/AdpP family)